jgi:uncharacterized membrane protein YraQ (UPF0718 family)
MDILLALGHALQSAFAMFWEVFWPLVLGFALSAIVQALVSHRTLARTLGGDSPRSLALATLFGVASSSCSCAAVALARSLFRKGASFTAAMVFELASTNLVIELGIILIVLPVLDIYRRYYGGRVALYILGTFYVTMALAGYAVEVLFGALGIIPTGRSVGAIAEGPAWNYTTVLNIVFCLVAAVLVVRFLRTGGPDMLRMMNVPADAMHEHAEHHSPAMAGMEHDAGPHDAMTGHATSSPQGRTPMVAAEVDHAIHQHGRAAQGDQRGSAEHGAHGKQ